MWIGRLFTRDSVVRRRAAVLCHAERGPGLPSGWRVWSVVCGVRMGLKSRKTVKQPLLRVGEGRLLTKLSESDCSSPRLSKAEEAHTV